MRLLEELLYVLEKALLFHVQERIIKMAASEVITAESNYLNYSTGLLVSILLCYPEVVTISCNQEQQTMILKFLVVKECGFEALQNKLRQALELFHQIEGRKIQLLSIEKFEQELDLIVISRDLSSITHTEINLIVEIMKSELGAKLIADECSLPEEEVILQEEIIIHMMAAVRSNGTEKNITAVREDGRVLVFNG